MISTINKLNVLIFSFVPLITLLTVLLFVDLSQFRDDVNTKKQELTDVKPDYWKAPDSNAIRLEKDSSLIRYGKKLISSTSNYLGPEGTISKSTNGMNCQNCHLDGGTKIFGNNYSAVSATYPKFRSRSGTIESIEKRINDCFERSLNGKALSESSREMKAIVAYIKWLGADVSKGKTPKGAGLIELTFIDRPASPEKGKILFDEKCAVCHGKDGQGLANTEGNGWAYPPMWGDRSYNIGAGLYRLSRFAGYIKANMPLGATYDSPQLTDEESWDLAAYVNSMPRPSKDISKDWPDISIKPFDHPFGPFTDGFDEKQHKYGPFTPIVDKSKKLSKLKLGS